MTYLLKILVYLLLMAHGSGTYAALLFYDNFAMWSADTQSFYEDGLFGSGCGTAFSGIFIDPGPVRLTISTTDSAGGVFSCSATGDLVNGWHYSGRQGGTPHNWTIGFYPDSAFASLGMPMVDNITAFGLDLRINSPTKSVTLAFFDTSLPNPPLATVEVTVASAGDERFFGVLSSAPLDNFFQLNSADEGFAFDNIRLGTARASAFGVPTPTTILLFGLGLIGLVFMRYRASSRVEHLLIVSS